MGNELPNDGNFLHTFQMLSREGEPTRSGSTWVFCRHRDGIINRGSQHLDFPSLDGRGNPITPLQVHYWEKGKPHSPLRNRGLS